VEDKNKVHIGSGKIALGLKEMGIDPDDVIVGFSVDAGERLESIYRAANWLPIGDFKDEQNYRTCKLGDIRYRWPKV
jgi:hypothetical protein